MSPVEAPAVDEPGLFASIARFVVRFRWLVILFWVVAVPVTAKTLPSLASVASLSVSQFLPNSSPSIRADHMARPFEGKNVGASAVIVAYRATGRLTRADDQAITRLIKDVRDVPKVTGVQNVAISPDGKADELLVTTSLSPLSGSHQGFVNRVHSTFLGADAPAGLSLHLTGPIPEEAAAASNTVSESSLEGFSVAFIILLLLLVFRSPLAALATLIPAGLALAVAGPVIAEASKLGFSVSVVAEELLTVVMLGAGTDYGIFLVSRVREEQARGQSTASSVVRALTHVGESISFSAFTVIAALLTLLLASFGLYRGLGPALAVGLGVLLIASLTLTPALLAVCGRSLFWPTPPKIGVGTTGFWGRIAERVVRRPWAVLLAGAVLFTGLALGLTGYRSTGFGNPSAPARSDAAIGARIIARHFRATAAAPDRLLLTFNQPVWNDLGRVEEAQRELEGSRIFKELTGPFAPGSPVDTKTLRELHAKLGPADRLPPVEPPGTRIPAPLYAFYRATSEFISPDGRTVEFFADLRGGPSGSAAAMAAIPQARETLARVARGVGAQASGISSQDAASYDVSHTANVDLERTIPVVLAIIAVLLALLLRSLVAPWYLILTVGLSYLASLGFATMVFVDFGSQTGLNFILPFLMFVFSMALGEDYNILLMSRVREEVLREGTTPEAITRAVGQTGGAITSAGIILAGTFGVLGVLGGANIQIEEIGVALAFGVFLDTFFVRTLFVPALVRLFGRRNWWPSRTGPAHPSSTPARADTSEDAAP